MSHEHTMWHIGTQCQYTFFSWFNQHFHKKKIEENFGILAFQTIHMHKNLYNTLQEREQPQQLHIRTLLRRNTLHRTHLMGYLLLTFFKSIKIDFYKHRLDVCYVFNIIKKDIFILSNAHLQLFSACCCWQFLSLKSY